MGVVTLCTRVGGTEPNPCLQNQGTKGYAEALMSFYTVRFQNQISCLPNAASCIPTSDTQQPSLSLITIDLCVQLGLRK